MYNNLQLAVTYFYTMYVYIYIEIPTSVKDDILFVTILWPIHHAIGDMPRASKNHPIPTKKKKSKNFVHVAKRSDDFSAYFRQFITHDRISL